jgi:diguanylate cyclase
VRADAGVVTVSGGVATASPFADAESLMREADVALYAAKRAGRNRIACSSERDVSVTPGTGDEGVAVPGLA